MPDRDLINTRIDNLMRRGRPWPEQGKGRFVEAEAAGLDQFHDRAGGQGLGERGDAEALVRRNRLHLPDVAVTVASGEDEPTILGDGEGSSGNFPLAEERDDGGVERAKAWQRGSGNRQVGTRRGCGEEDKAGEKARE